MTVWVQWTGYVLEVGTQSFWVRLQDAQHPQFPEEEAELPLAGLSPFEQTLLKPGLCFQLTLSEVDGQGRLRWHWPPYSFTQSDIDAAEQKAEQMAQALNWE